MVTPLYDSHCHPTDTVGTLSKIQGLKAAGLCIMATRVTDQHLVSETADSYPDKVIPCFGFHPWFVHSIYDDSTSEEAPDKTTHFGKCLYPQPDDAFVQAMPDLVPLSRYVESIRQNLIRHPNAMVGEVGLDRSFRLPDPNRPREDSHRHVLSKYRTETTHQSFILEAQLRLAAEHGRACSIHGVQAHGYLFNEISKLWKGQEKPSKSALRKMEADEKFRNQSAEPQEKKLEFFDKDKDRTFPPRICLHSYSGTADMLGSWTNPRIPADIFFSFSQVINGRYDRWQEVVKKVPDHRLLIESDYHNTELIDDSLEQALHVVCEAKGWEEEFGRKKLEENWRRFVGIDAKKE
ncbi:protein of unknown function [Taphrina deformans PYCC 5710]|uniref:Cut9 interacting protein Scn1 n=1 Tax=Taphrina deformans (strain PYCC 5710 / ATCC 11124 / CBS 356.35 / IMI 108563 / JCM 9778 / NBRC 8474) TaxID=1097556 RepID=R4XDZ6_TAPDE|nr:protein of unknown function [Taphrina deformans PYCC 5710]|eukprot:CCG83882.1 protein of unknown function [Taphrina deformans PYCC 5710]